MSIQRNTFFPEIPDDLYEEVLTKLRISNAQRIYVISIVGFCFAFLLLSLDIIRYSRGTLLPGSLHFYLFLNHLALFLFIIPIITIRMNPIAFASGRYKYGRLFIYSWTLFLGVVLIVMSYLTLKDRSSLAIYFIYIIIANFGLLMVHIDRILLNSTSFLLIIACTLSLFYGNLQVWFTSVFEAVGVTSVSFAVSTQIFNARIRQIAADVLLEEKNAEIVKEKIRGDKLLNNILPEDVATELMATGKVIPRHYASTTVMMVDFKEFSNISRSMTPDELIEALDYCFKNFDRITSAHHLEKIKTIGDAYLCVGGLPEVNNTHPFDSIAAAKGLIDFLEKWKIEQQAIGKPFFEARIGIHTGPVVAGVVGDKKFAFDIWGDAVNTAARIESEGEVGKINISQMTYDLVKEKLSSIHRGKIPIKHGEPLDMYFVTDLSWVD